MEQFFVILLQEEERENNIAEIESSGRSPISYSSRFRRSVMSVRATEFFSDVPSREGLACGRH